MGAMWASRVFISYVSVSRENKLSVQVLALMGFYVRNRPVCFPQPIQAAAEAYVGAIQKPLPLGRAERSRR